MQDWVRRLLAYPEMAGQGHCERIADANLGLGWIYYGLARTIRPRTAVVIGSYRGFVPLVLGKALIDNFERGRVHFIDPSLVDDFWMDAEAVQSHFSSFGVSNIVHSRLTTQEFLATEYYRGLADIGLLFIDGYHTEEQAEFDFSAFGDRLSEDAVVVFHDSVRIRVSRMYGEGRHYTHTVKRLIDRLKQSPHWQILDLPFDAGVTLIRRNHAAAKP